MSSAAPKLFVDSRTGDLVTEKQLDLLTMYDTAVADVEGMARAAADFEALSDEEREQIDAIGWGSRRPKTS